MRAHSMITVGPVVGLVISAARTTRRETRPNGAGATATSASQRSGGRGRRGRAQAGVDVEADFSASSRPRRCQVPSTRGGVSARNGAFVERNGALAVARPWHITRRTHECAEPGQLSRRRPTWFAHPGPAAHVSPTRRRSPGRTDALPPPAGVARASSAAARDHLPEARSAIGDR